MFCLTWAYPKPIRAPHMNNKFFDGAKLRNGIGPTKSRATAMSTFPKIDIMTGYDRRSQHWKEPLNITFHKYVWLLSHISCKKHSKKVDGTEYDKDIPDICRTHACSLPGMGLQHGLNEAKAAKIHHIVDVWSENGWTPETRNSAS